jgi:hypothetical protein
MKSISCLLVIPSLGLGSVRAMYYVQDRRAVLLLMYESKRLRLRSGCSPNTSPHIEKVRIAM